MHGICFPEKSDKLCPRMAAKMILCNLFQPTAKAPSWTSSRNCECSDKDTIPRWLGPPPPCANTADCVQQGGRAKTGSASALDRPWIRRVRLSASGPSRCFNLILRLLYFLCQCDGGVGVAQSRLIQSADGKSSQGGTATGSTSRRTGKKKKKQKKNSHLLSVNPPNVEAAKGKQSF